jgi:SRSO17 transposase
MTTRSPDVIEEFLDEAQFELRHEAQRRSFAWYLTGLLGPLERKSVEPIAGLVDPEHIKKTQGTLLHFLAYGTWKDAPLRALATRFVLQRAAPHTSDVLGVILDDTGMLKQGSASVGVQRQYTGSAGKIANCQVAVTTAIYTARETIPLDIRLYLPERWASDPKRRAKVGVPEDVVFATKLEIGLKILTAAHEAGLPLGKVLLADAGYGYSAAFRNAVLDLGLRYGVGVQSTQRVWDAAGTWTRPMTVKELAAVMPPREFRRTTWREGREGKRLSARFAAMRVQVAAGDDEPTQKDPRQWLVIEWRDGEAEPVHFYLCTFPPKWSRKRIVRTLKERWRIERMHEDLKGEVGFDHYEGRSWVGWHHHVTAAMCAYAVLVAERATAFPPCKAARTEDRSHGRAA